jgi:hypothetical protein
MFMPTHVHLLVFPMRDESCMSDFLLSVKQPVTQRAVAFVKRERPEMLHMMRDEQPNGGGDASILGARRWV